MRSTLFFFLLGLKYSALFGQKRHNGVMSNTPSKIVYTARAEVTGGRSGQAHSFDPDLTLDMRMPPALGGPGGGANPEALFAMGYGACFQGALGLAAKEAGVDVTDSKVAVSVGIGPEGVSAF